MHGEYFNCSEMSFLKVDCLEEIHKRSAYQTSSRTSLL